MKRSEIRGAPGCRPRPPSGLRPDAGTRRLWRHRRDGFRRRDDRGWRPLAL